ncbi:rhodanese-like domain-containing protein [Haloarculaceae archaeon H-GB2-1]|nr:rhodanese-like domain-containing protein [Haloarculaceae archaeon H-GB1-1]MEA5406675.1 rhodanese-like domain-containing protein [Haloarculaceae archaeon H-GB2-1]
MDGEITTDDLATLLDDGEEVRIVDIRSPAAFRRGHIPGSENVPFPELTTRAEELSVADRIVTVCPHGESSIQAARLLQSYEGTSDARIESLAGGLNDWDGDLEAGEETATAANEGPDAPF